MSRSLLDKLSSEYVTPLLRRAGFRKSRLVWNRSVDGFVHCIVLQGSQWNTRDETSFYLRGGLMSTDVFRILWGKEPPKFVQESVCFPRIGWSYLPGIDEGGEWNWTLKREEDVGQYGVEVRDAIEKVFFRAFEACDSLQAIIARVRPSRKGMLVDNELALGIMRHLCGDASGAEAVFSGVLARCSGGGAWEDVIAGLRTRLRQDCG